ncbi:Clp protease ClpP [Janthinobacterium sp. GMG2]|uniref:ClpP-like prohead protease/major capsid protein fusion protein n=1 Tax=Janthinobacterium sp. GMG2 TaxID=3096606 RepID=UPI0029F5C26E|nr:ClpP-like prohead protease/major capsid protein fusion protein [Janthinobacterium sp. GMG2]MDX8121582.1 Clp protease ClpP [Janthinobacterium sp. GMG2]
MPTPNAASNQAASWYTIRPSARAGAAASASSAEILIYGDIGESWYGDTITASNFVRDVAALDVDHMTVRINSYGGSVTDGIAIHNAIKRHKAHVTTIIDSIAASIASLIAVAGDTVQMAENAAMMIHAPWGWTEGNSVAMREYADMLDTWSEAMATSYASKTGGDRAEILALLTDGKDHWYTAEQALAAKLVDATISALPIAASASLALSVKARFDSFVLPQIPAAAAAPTPITPKENPTMSGTTAPVAAAPIPAATALTHAQITAAALAADKTRRTDISAAFAKFSNVAGVAELQAACADDHGCSAEQAGIKLLAHLAQGAGPVAGTHIVTVEDSRDKFRAGAAASIMARGKLAKDETNNNYRGFTLLDIARESLVHAGVKTTGMDKMGLIAAAFTHTGSDFPLLLANVANKAMLKGYEEAEETFQLWTAKGTLTDFKPGKRVDLNMFPALAQVQDGGEYTYATIGERGETVQLATYGKMFSITRQGIINDDIDAFSKIPQRMGRAAIRTIGDLVYAILTSNPPMSDGVPLFHADHKNLLAAAAISTAGIDAMRVGMGLQKQGESLLGLRMAHLLVPLALEGTASVVRDSEYEVGAASKNNTTPNSVRNTFDVISEARLDANSSTTWYGTANAALHDTVEVSYLDGNEAPTLEQQNGWHVDGVEFKVRIDAGVKALDYRTMVKNPGQ